MCCLSNKLKFGMIPHSFKNDPSNSISHFQHPSIFVLSDVQSTYFFVFVYLLRKVEQFSYSKLRSKTKVSFFFIIFLQKAQFFVLRVDECLGRNETQDRGNWDEVVRGRGLELLCRHGTFDFLRANEPSCGGLLSRHILKKLINY